ncbi:unnamed protein product [Callosobruchus maculatus]|uniref:Uncharacterized protein n=1 Tax=Callosobruchus maculatus TaxID=64391 RepID=A0A653CAW7_CALMS|nr:unnamed protein product [Callosobruchus maculatus]
MNSISPTTGDHQAPDLSHLTEEEKEHQEKLWKEELAQIEDEIATLRTVLASKMRRSAELKRNLGITVWKEVSEDINQGIKNVKENIRQWKLKSGKLLKRSLMLQYTRKQHL